MTETNDKEQASEQPVDAEGPMTEAEQIEALTTERDDLLGRLQRVSADYLNYQKRAGREKAEARDFIVADVLAAMFDVMDDLELAVNHAKENHPADDPLLIGTDLVHQKAQGVFKRFGVERIAAEGKVFDPALHEAIVSQPTDEVEPMTILSEVRTGYRMGERVVRPARVIVAAAATNDDNAVSDCETADRPEGADDADV